jgi:hypothetical protein
VKEVDEEDIEDEYKSIRNYHQSLSFLNFLYCETLLFYTIIDIY